MKRIAFAAAAVALVSSLVVASPARADHHPACTTGPILQTVKLTASGGNLNFTGSVLCKGAAAGAITSLTITPVAGTATPAPLTSAASCVSCTDVISAAGSIPAAPGVYQVRMNFRITHTDGRIWNPARSGRYAFTEQTDVQRVCEHSWTVACPA